MAPEIILLIHNKLFLTRDACDRSALKSCKILIIKINPMGMAKGKLYEIRYKIKIVVKNNGRNSYKKKENQIR